MEDKVKIYYPDYIDDSEIFGTQENIIYSTPTAETTSDKGTGVLTTVPSSINPRPKPQWLVADNLISLSLDTLKKKILGEYTFGVVGALQVGEYVSGVSGDLRISPSGIVARNSDGVTTFSIDGDTGNATFLGTISAGSVISASISANNITGTIVDAQIATINWAKITDVAITNADIVNLSADKITTGTLTGISIAIGSSNSIFKADSNGIYLGNATYASAPFRVSMSGDVYASSVTIEGTITCGSGSSYEGDPIDEDYIGELSVGKLQVNVLAALQANVSTLSAIVANIGSVTAGSITGVSITASSGELVCKGDTALEFETSGGTSRGYIGAYGSNAGIMIAPVGSLYLDANLEMRNYSINDVSELIFRSSSQSISDNNASDMYIKFGDNLGFRRNGTYVAVIDDNIWTGGKLYTDESIYAGDDVFVDGKVYADSYEINSEAFEGDPFPVIQTVKGVGKKGDKTKMVGLDHDSIHDVLKSVSTDRKGKKRVSMSLSSLVMAQNEAIIQLKYRVDELQKLVDICKI